MTRLSSPRFIRFASLCFGLALTTGTLACDDDGGDEVSDGTDGDGDGDGTGDGDGEGDGDGDALSHAADMQPIWDASCLAMCHEPDGNAVSVLDLSGNAYGNIVSVPSTQAPGMNLVEPGNAAESYLVAKLRGTQVAAGGLGAMMPSGTQMLPEETIALVEAWIDEGAAP
ncbi:MAG: hypothetical protein R6X02_13455 [Enhygromyxa sp.]